MTDPFRILRTYHTVRCTCGHILTTDDPLAFPGPEHGLGGICRTCGCARGDILPAEGERPVFGIHRIRVQDAITAPGWPTQRQVEAEHLSRIKKWKPRPKKPIDAMAGGSSDSGT